MQNDNPEGLWLLNFVLLDRMQRCWELSVITKESKGQNVKKCIKEKQYSNLVDD